MESCERKPALAEETHNLATRLGKWLRGCFMKMPKPQPAPQPPPPPEDPPANPTQNTDASSEASSAKAKRQGYNSLVVPMLNTNASPGLNNPGG